MSYALYAPARLYARLTRLGLSLKDLMEAERHDEEMK